MDWTNSVEAWVAHLRAAGWPLSIGDELNLHELARRLREQGIEVRSADAAARWFGPLLCGQAEQQRRLPALLRSWQPSAAPSTPLPRGLDRVARAVLPPAAPAALRRSRGWLVVLGLLVALAFAGWLWQQARPTPVPSPAADPKPAAPLAGPRGEGGIAPHAWGALLWLTPFAAALAVRRLRRRRSHVLLRGLAPRDAPREALRVALPRFDLYAPRLLRATVADLRRHRWVAAETWDGARSAAATVRQGGRVALVKGRRRALPEYLLLVDLRGPDDILGTLAQLLTQALASGDVRVERFDFVGDPRRLRRHAPESRAHGQLVTLGDLHTQHPDHRLLVLSDLGGFADAEGRAVRAWVDELRAWPEAALLTPLPAPQWGPRERALARRGLLLAEATPQGLADLSRRLRTDRSEVQDLRAEAADSARAGGAEATAFDQHFAADPYRWLGEQAPPAPALRQMLEDLYGTLGPAATLLLQALAVFPQLHPSLTLALGRMLDDGEGRALLDEAVFTRLARVPWLRHGRFPDWLRLALLSDLRERSRSQPARADGDDESRVRAAWATLLAPRERSAGGSGGAEDLPLEVVRSADPALAPLVAASLRAQPRQGWSEALLLAFLEGRELPPLAVAWSTDAGGGPVRTAADAAAAGRKATVDAALLLALLLFGGLGAWIAPQVWLTAVVDRPVLLGVLWSAAGAAGLLCLITWYRRELGALWTGRWAFLALPPGGLTFWRLLPEASAVATLALVLAALQVGGIEDSSAGRLMAALLLLGWCFLAPGREVLRWLPLLVLLMLRVRLPELPFLDSGVRLNWAISGGFLPYLLLAWLGLRHRLEDVLALVWLASPFWVANWTLTAEISATGSLSNLVLALVVVYLAGDVSWRRGLLAPRPRSHAALDALALLPLGVVVGLGLPTLGFGLAWAPGNLLMGLTFIVGWTLERGWRWIAVLLVVWTATLLIRLAQPEVFEWPELSAAVLSPRPLVSQLADVLSPLLAFVLGRLCRKPPAPQVMVAVVLGLFVGLATLVRAETLDGRTSWFGPLLLPLLPLLALLPAGRVLAARGLWIAYGAGFGLWFGSMLLGPAVRGLAQGELSGWGLYFTNPSPTWLTLLLAVVAAQRLLQHLGWAAAAAGPDGTNEQGAVGELDTRLPSLLKRLPLVRGILGVVSVGAVLMLAVAMWKAWLLVGPQELPPAPATTFGPDPRPPVQQALPPPPAASPAAASAVPAQNVSGPGQNMSGPGQNIRRERAIQAARDAADSAAAAAASAATGAVKK